ncbi:MAG: Ni/Fe hydrogenase, partial [Candidatus Thiodiazotropha sp. (ex Notomyrtea botanica)]|nr:Ni/Fe hydrogenase [Candidatus Thiodiazotropha sp. (ex Notomyrtea botanica)]
SWPVESGHGCLGCSEPDFWDAGGFYNALSIPDSDITRRAGVVAAAGVALGAAAGALNRSKRAKAAASHETVTIDDLDKTS